MSNKTYTVNVLTTDMKRVEYVEIGSIHSIFQHLRTKLNMLGVSSIIKVIVRPLDKTSL